jgi:hypothetical protein
MDPQDRNPLIGLRGPVGGKGRGGGPGCVRGGRGGGGLEINASGAGSAVLGLSVYRSLL